MDDSPTTFCCDTSAVVTPPSATFRVDASQGIGSGHVRRCLVLAGALAADGWQIAFACCAGTKEAVPSLAQSDFTYRVVPAGGEGLRALWDLAPGGCDLLVVDHYGLEASFERSCRAWAKQILVIDDLADRLHECDILVDQTPGRQANDYAGLVPGNCSVLAGSQFALLDPRFRRARERLGGPADRVQRVLVSFGGTDPAGATLRVVEALAAAKLGAAVDIVLGTASDDAGRIRELAARLEPPAMLHIAVDDMAGLISQADMAIGAGGVSALERCCLGVPSVTITIADNQRKLADELARAGATDNLGPVTELSTSEIADAVAQLARSPARRLKMRAAALAVTDGLGAGRVRAACSPALLAKDGRPVQLRPASMADAALMLAWQSTPGIRAYSRNPAAPLPAEHAEWMQRKLADPGCIFQIIVHDGRPVGVLRLDRLADGSYEISILVAAEAQNKKIGGAALEAAKRLLPHALIHATIHPDNLASIRMFERAGYRRAAEDWILAPPSPARSFVS